MPCVTFTSPAIYRVGFNETLAREAFRNINVYRLKLNSNNSFGIEESLNYKGIIKLITDNKKRIIGGHALGTNSSDYMQEIAYAITHRHTIKDILKAIHPYLSHAEAVKECVDISWQKKQPTEESKGLTAFYHKIFRKRK
jgi:dihydrolipoamide dehydrogenase